MAPNITPIHMPKSGPAASTATIVKAGNSDNFSAVSSSAENDVREIGRDKKIWIRKIPINAAPIKPALLMTAVNQLDVLVDPNPIPSPQVDAMVSHATAFQWDLS